MNLNYKFILIVSFSISNINSWFWLRPKQVIKQQQQKTVYQRPNLLILDYASNNKNSRLIQDDFEYIIASQFCKMLAALINQNTIWKIVIPKAQTPNLSNLQIASWSNENQANLFININFYQHSNCAPQINIYYNSFNNTTDFWTAQNKNLSFISYDLIYKNYIKQSQNYAQILNNSIKLYSDLNCDSPIGLPLKTVLGLNCPAITLDIGIINNDCLDLILEPISSSINALLDSI